MTAQEEAPEVSYEQVLDYELRNCAKRIPRNTPVWLLRIIAIRAKRMATRKYERYQWSLDNSKFVREHKSLYEALDRSKALKKAGVLTKSGHFKKR